MARTASQGRSRKSKSSSTSRRSSSAKGRSSRRRSSESWLEGIYRTPAFSYVAGGIGFAALAGAAYRFADSYPRITSFFRDNLELIENKLAEFRGDASASSDLSDEARH